MSTIGREREQRAREAFDGPEVVEGAPQLSAQLARELREIGAVGCSIEWDVAAARAEWTLSWKARIRTNDGREQYGEACVTPTDAVLSAIGALVAFRGYR